MTNPPFGGKEGREAQTRFAFKTGATQVLFLQHVIDSLKSTGRCGMVLDEGVLFRTNETAFVKSPRRWRCCEGFDAVGSSGQISGAYSRTAGSETRCFHKTLRIVGIPDRRNGLAIELHVQHHCEIKNMARQFRFIQPFVLWVPEPVAVSRSANSISRESALRVSATTSASSGNSVIKVSMSSLPTVPLYECPEGNAAFGGAVAWPRRWPK